MACSAEVSNASELLEESDSEGSDSGTPPESAYAAKGRMRDWSVTRVAPVNQYEAMGNPRTLYTRMRCAIPRAKRCVVLAADAPKLGHKILIAHKANIQT